MDLRFDDKHVLVTGGARGIGLEIVRHFCQAGAMVTVFDYNGDALDQAVAQWRDADLPVNPLLVDVSVRTQVVSAVDRVETIAPIDVLVNNAGICEITAFLKIPAEEWQKTLDINLTGAFHVAQSVCRYMARRRKGVVLNMSSKNGLDAELGHAHYNASKAGLIMLTKTIAIELAHLGIRANAVCPGYVRSPINDDVDSDEFVAEFADRYVPIGRVGNVSEIPPLFLFLASDAASYITGQTFVLDGGQLAGQKPWRSLLEEFMRDLPEAGGKG